MPGTYYYFDKLLRENAFLSRDQLPPQPVFPNTILEHYQVTLFQTQFIHILCRWEEEEKEEEEEEEEDDGEEKEEEEEEEKEEEEEEEEEKEEEEEGRGRGGQRENVRGREGRERGQWGGGEGAL